MLINVAKYATAEDAFTAARNGDRVYFPGMKSYPAPANGWVIEKNLEIFGDGPGVPGASGAFVLSAANDSAPVFRLEGSLHDVYIHDLQLRGTGAAGTGSGIRVVSAAEDALGNLRLARLAVTGFGGHGIDLSAYSPATKTIAGASLLDLYVSGCGGAGILLQGVDQAYAAGCIVKACGLNGLLAVQSQILLCQCWFSGNVVSSAVTDPIEGNLKLKNCPIARVDACGFSELASGNVKTGIGIVGSAGAIVGSCSFEASSGSSASGIILSATAGPAVVLVNHFKNVATLIKVAAGALDVVVLPQHDETGSGTIDLPDPNGGMFAVPHVIQSGTIQMRGMLAPSYASDPTENLQEGMLAFNATGKAFRLYSTVGGVAKWRSLLTA